MIFLLVYVALCLGLFAANNKYRYKRIFKVTRGKRYTAVTTYEPPSMWFEAGLAISPPLAAGRLIFQSIDYTVNQDRYDLNREIWAETRKLEDDIKRENDLADIADRRFELERMKADRTRKLEISMGILTDENDDKLRTEAQGKIASLERRVRLGEAAEKKLAEENMRLRKDLRRKDELLGMGAKAYNEPIRQFKEMIDRSAP